MPKITNARERLVRIVTRLETLEAEKAAASLALRDEFSKVGGEGFDVGTLKAVLKLRKLSPEQRKERSSLIAIYMASLGMLEGDSLPDEARRRLDEQYSPKPTEPKPDVDTKVDGKPSTPTAPKPPAQRPLALKDPELARQEGRDAAAAEKRIYDNPYPAGDPCRAAWDEGWCEAKKSNGMETPPAFQRRTPEKPSKPSKDDKKGDA
jgi:uncharacterized protein (UPF0335 family)